MRARLDGLKQIAAWLRMTERSVRRLQQRLPDGEKLPLFRYAPGVNARVSCYVDDLHAWERSRIARGWRARR